MAVISNPHVDTRPEEHSQIDPCVVRYRSWRSLDVALLPRFSSHHAMISLHA
jgi:hypothetical protein